MTNSQKYEGVRYNELTQSAEIHSVKDGKKKKKKWTDADEAQSMNYIESAFKIYSKEKHSAALRILFEILLRLSSKAFSSISVERICSNNSCRVWMLLSVKK